jgi:hypothetical protein
LFLGVSSVNGDIPSPAVAVNELATWRAIDLKMETKIWVEHLHIHQFFAV